MLGVANTGGGPGGAPAMNWGATIRCGDGTLGPDGTVDAEI